MIRDRLYENMAFKQNPEGSEGINYDDIWERAFLARGTARLNSMSCEPCCCLFSIPQSTGFPTLHVSSVYDLH